MAKRRGLSDLVFAALITAAANAPTAAYVAYTHHQEQMARILADEGKRESDGKLARDAKAADLQQARCTAALQFLGDESLNPSLKGNDTQALLTSMAGVATSTCASRTRELNQ